LLEREKIVAMEYTIPPTHDASDAFHTMEKSLSVGVDFKGIDRL
jgi:hypothetical protein